MTPAESAGPRPPQRGVNGLTTQDLRHGREVWWNAAFTRALLEALPADVRTLVEVGCGLGRAGQELLPRAPGLVYVGVDIDAARIDTARREFAEGPLAGRAAFVAGRAESLPLPDGGTEALLFCMTLQHISSPVEALREARRVLEPGGTLVAAEPDSLAERWFFDGPRFEITEAFVTLLRRGRDARAPRDLAIGSRVPDLVRSAGFSDVNLSVHAVFETRYDTARACAGRWRDMALLIARACGLTGDSPETRACLDAIDAWLSTGDPERPGQCGTVVPAFITTARRPA